jgi:hypothetical protein
LGATHGQYDSPLDLEFSPRTTYQWIPVSVVVAQLGARIHDGIVGQQGAVPLVQSALKSEELGKLHEGKKKPL